MNSKILYIFLFFGFGLLLPFVGNAQEMKVSGTVYDSSGTVPLKQALAMAVRVKDSLLLGFTRTDAAGGFLLDDFAPDTFALIIAYPSYDNKTFYIFGNASNAEIDVQKVSLSMESTELNDVVIYANKNPIYYSGDTLVYVADSFKVAENAVVEDLLKKLPGIQVDKDGKITSQGKSISQVLVDGDEFFGSDPTIATKNLAAKGVESVKVYEKKSETASDGEDATIQVMDLRLKEDAKKGYFGKTSLATDFQQFHEGELLLNKFNGPQKISVFALGSTTPRTNVSRADMNKFGLDNERGNSMRDGMMLWNQTEQAAGVPQTFSGGVFYSDKYGKRKQTKFSANYTFNDYQLISSTASRSQYILPSDTSYFSDDSTHNVDLSQTHKVNFKLFTQIDSLTSFELKPKFSASTGSLENINMSDYLGEDEVLNRNSRIENKTKSTGLSLDNEAIFIHKFMKPRRELNLNYELSASTGESEGTLITYNNYFTTNDLNDTIDQQKLNYTNAQTHIGRLTYTEPISKKWKVEVEYLYEYGKSSQDKQTIDELNGSYSLINTYLSNNFENLRQQHRFGTDLIYESRVHTITGGVRVRNIDINNDNLTTATTIHQNISNFLPKFSYMFKPAPSKRIRFNYSTKSTQPAISDLQLVQNNTNPNKIVIGNPDLKPNYEHTANLMFNSWQALSGRYIWGFMYSSYTNNAFATSTSYDDYGRTIAQTVNVDGNLYSGLNMGAGIPFYKKIFTASPSANVSYSKYSNFVSGDRNITYNQAATGGMELEMSLDSLQISIEGKYTYNNPKNSISSLSSSAYSVQAYTASVNWTLPGKMKIGSDVSYTINGQRAAGYNLNYFVWNATISRSFLKTENLILSVNGYDILNQNISAQRQVNGNIITDNRTKIISRYFLVKLVYKFNNNKTKEEDAKMGWH